MCAPVFKCTHACVSVCSGTIRGLQVIFLYHSPSLHLKTGSHTAFRTHYLGVNMADQQALAICLSPHPILTHLLFHIPWRSELSSTYLHNKCSYIVNQPTSFILILIEKVQYSSLYMLWFSQKADVS